MNSGFTVRSNFFGNFKNGDNVAHNFQVLRLLYRYFNQESDENKKLLCKPIIISLVSVVEALLDDLFLRIRNYYLEGVPGLDFDRITAIRGEMEKKPGKDFDFKAQIKTCLDKNLFNQSMVFYENLDELRQLRNRIHIQNDHNFAEPDEQLAFSLQKKEEAEKACELILWYLENHYKRDSSYYYVRDLQVPWNRHYLVQ